MEELHQVVLAGDHVALSRLLESGADPNLRDAQGRTALHLLAECEGPAPALAATLLQHGADPCLQDRQGATPLDRALLAGNADLADRFRGTLPERPVHVSKKGLSRLSPLSVLAALLTVMIGVGLGTWLSLSVFPAAKALLRGPERAATPSDQVELADVQAERAQQALESGDVEAAVILAGPLTTTRPREARAVLEEAIAAFADRGQHDQALAALEVLRRDLDAPEYEAIEKRLSRSHKEFRAQQFLSESRELLQNGRARLAVDQARQGRDALMELGASKARLAEAHGLVAEALLEAGYRREALAEAGKANDPNLVARIEQAPQPPARPKRVIPKPIKITGMKSSYVTSLSKAPEVHAPKVLHADAPDLKSRLSSFFGDPEAKALRLSSADIEVVRQKDSYYILFPDGRCYDATAAQAGPFVLQQLCFDYNIGRQLEPALHGYYRDHGSYPETLQELQGEYLRRMPRCPSQAGDSYSETYHRNPDGSCSLGCESMHRL